MVRHNVARSSAQQLSHIPVEKLSTLEDFQQSSMWDFVKNRTNSNSFSNSFSNSNSNSNSNSFSTPALSPTLPPSSSSPTKAKSSSITKPKTHQFKKQREYKPLLLSLLTTLLLLSSGILLALNSVDLNNAAQASSFKSPERKAVGLSGYTGEGVVFMSSFWGKSGDTVVAENERSARERLEVSEAKRSDF